MPGALPVSEQDLVPYMSDYRDAPMRAFSTTRENLPYLAVPGPFQNRLAPPVLEIRADSSSKKRVNDLTLRCPCLFRTTATATGILDRKMERCASRFVSDRSIAAGIEKTFYSGSTSGTHGSMQ